MNSKEYIELSKAKENERIKKEEEAKNRNYEEAVTGIKHAAAIIEGRSRSERRLYLVLSFFVTVGLFFVELSTNGETSFLGCVIGVVLFHTIQKCIRITNEIKLMKTVQKDEIFQQKTQEETIAFWEEIRKHYQSILDEKKHAETKKQTSFIYSGNGSCMPIFNQIMKD